jgi:hypothetical protein
LRVLERLAIRHHSVLTEAFGLELRRPPSDSSFRYFFQQVDVASPCAAIRDWTIAQIPGDALDLDQVVCDGKTLKSSIIPTAGGGSAFIAQVTLYTAALGVAIIQACNATGKNYERAVLRQLLGELDLEGVLIQTDALHTQRPFFGSSRSRAPFSPDGQGQPKDVASSDPQPVPGKAAHPFYGYGSRDQPRPRHHLDLACQASSRAHQRGMDRHQLDRGSYGQWHP